MHVRLRCIYRRISPGRWNILVSLF